MASLGGGTIPQIVEKFVKKNVIDMSICKCYQNPLGNLKKQFSNLYQLWEAAMWLLLEGWYTRNPWFLRKSQQIFYISSWNLFGSKILSSICGKHQKFDYGYSSYLGEAT